MPGAVAPFAPDPSSRHCPEYGVTSPNRESWSAFVRSRDENLPAKIGKASLAGTHKRKRHVHYVEVISSPTLLGPV